MTTSLSLDSRIHAFVELGNVMGQAAESYALSDSDFINQYTELNDSLQTAHNQNPWFTPANIRFALNEWKEALSEQAINTWLKDYAPMIQNTESKKIAVIMAGNIPLVGFHDFMCTLLAGHSFIGKLSSTDKVLLPAIADVLCTIEPIFKQKIEFTEGILKEFDAIIATGSNNTARYFEYYFSKYPHIIRKNRNGVAVLNGNENNEALKKLGIDICSYFGLGCRNISKVFIPEGFSPQKLYSAIEPFNKILFEHFKYMNNHSYHRSIYLLNSTAFLDNDAFILKESEQYSSPISVLYYEFYKEIESLKEKLLQDDEQIQCIATEAFTSENTVPLGCTQSPGLADYADGIDILKFLIEL
ncbi:MAG: acyl-CoA reductase [Bacteroidales bacterium]|nr:acyl-CoA reductase [Bacteroidales bacterium]